MQYTKKNIIDALSKTLYYNSDTVSDEMCFYLCANKSLFSILRHPEHQLILGKRGTGKTTLLKAFNYFINHEVDFSKDWCISWYTRLNSTIPSTLEANLTMGTEDIIVYCIKAFLQDFVKFLFEKYDEIVANCSNFSKFQQEAIQDCLLALDRTVESGHLAVKEATKQDTETFEQSTDSCLEARIGLPKKSLLEAIGFQSMRGRKNAKQYTSSVEKEYIYYIDLNSISKMIEEILDLMHIVTLYVCIDEFSQIDRDISQTIQPQVAQAIKELFFSSKIVSVKISSVWNEQRMQHRQFGGLREGIELGHDIVLRKELNLNNMFSDSDALAYTFFSSCLLNNFLVGTNPAKFSQKERTNLMKDLIKQLFSSNAFQCLICGTQGVPRTFAVMLKDLLNAMDSQNEGKINISAVYECIINNYKIDVRQRIPDSSIICNYIDNYIDQTHHRFFALSIKEYNRLINYIDGLVANAALYQYPSAEVPRKFRNNYKFFLVHFGNYLDSAASNLKSLNEMAQDFTLYPKLTDELVCSIKDYTINFPNDALNEMYCTYCHHSFKREVKNGMAICPTCKRPIAYWY